MKVVAMEDAKAFVEFIVIFMSLLKKTITVLSKIALIALIGSTYIIALPNLSFAGDHNKRQSGRSGYLKTDPLFEDRLNIYDDSGRVKGYIKQDNLFKNRKNIYDEDGRQKGYLHDDYLYKGRTNIYDKHGGRKGYLKDDSLFEGRKNIYNNKGRRKGYLKEDSLFDDRYDIYKE
jgi:hypothetical protein